MRMLLVGALVAVSALVVSSLQAQTLAANEVQVAVVSPVALATTEGAVLPKELSGRWNFVNISGKSFNDAWSVKIQEQAPDGSVKGLLTFWGKSCRVTMAPMSGKFDGSALSLEASIGMCGLGKFQLTKKGTAYEGTYSIEGAPGVSAPGGATVSLSPT